MKKIRLDIEALAVETFATERDGMTEQGTVRAYSIPLIASAEGGCIVDGTLGTGEFYCICVVMVKPMDSSDGNC